jgi:hypothetical protein
MAAAMTSLRERADLCTAQQYEVRGIDSSFFVYDSEAAEKLDNADRKITTVNGFKVCCGDRCVNISVLGIK